MAKHKKIPLRVTQEGKEHLSALMREAGVSEEEIAKCFPVFKGRLIRVRELTDEEFDAKYPWIEDGEDESN